ncbi:MAG TPA: hypothetical protein V6D08_05695 [Candidatus Obscuribacterales bacterium]
MNRDKIRNTAVCRFDKRERVYVVESSLLDICTGMADTEEEAWEIFEDLLDTMYIKYLEGRRVGQYQKPGRPRAGKVELHARVKPDTKAAIFTLAQSLKCTPGEAVDFLVYQRVAQTSPTALRTAAPKRKAKRAGTKGQKSAR